MSVDATLVIDTGSDEPYDIDDAWFNYTHNLAPMLREAGYPGWQALNGAPASESGGMLRKVADTLRADPERFKALNPPNGWGSYEGAISVMERMADACARHPRAHWSVNG